MQSTTATTHIHSQTFKNLGSELRTVDREIFPLKIIWMKNFCVVIFVRFRLIHEIVSMVNDCNMDEHLESSWRLVYYWVSGEPGIAGYSHRSDIYLGECGLCASLFTDCRRVILFFAY